MGETSSASSFVHAFIHSSDRHQMSLRTRPGDIQDGNEALPCPLELSARGASMGQDLTRKNH